MCGARQSYSVSFITCRVGDRNACSLCCIESIVQRIFYHVEDISEAHKHVLGDGQGWGSGQLHLI